MLELDSGLVTAFHDRLATSNWVARLTQFLAEHSGLRGRAKLISDYNDDRFMGPESVVKHYFMVQLQETRGPLYCIQEAGVNFYPKEDCFRLVRLSWKCRWREEFKDQKDYGTGFWRSPPPELAEPSTNLRSRINLPRACLEGWQWEPTWSRFLNSQEARSGGLLPLGEQDGTLHVAVGDPRKLLCLNIMARNLGLAPLRHEGFIPIPGQIRRLEPYLAESEEAVQALLDQAFSPRLTCPVRVNVGAGFPHPLQPDLDLFRRLPPLEPLQYAFPALLNPNWTRAICAYLLPNVYNPAAICIGTDEETVQIIAQRVHGRYLDGAIERRRQVGGPWVTTLEKSKRKALWARLDTFTQWTQEHPEPGFSRESNGEIWHIESWTRHHHRCARRWCYQERPGDDFTTLFSAILELGFELTP